MAFTPSRLRMSSTRGTATRPENSPRDTADGVVMPTVAAHTLIASKSNVRHTFASRSAISSLHRCGQRNGATRSAVQRSVEAEAPGTRRARCPRLAPPSSSASSIPPSLTKNPWPMCAVNSATSMSTASAAPTSGVARPAISSTPPTVSVTATNGAIRPGRRDPERREELLGAAGRRACRARAPRR